MNDLTKMTIGQRINNALCSSNLLQKDLAKALGVTDNTVSYWCNGARTPNTEQIIQIARTLNVSSDYLLGLSDAATADMDMKAICDYTGLSEVSIKALTSYNENCHYLRGVLNFLLKNEFEYITRYMQNLHKDENIPDNDTQIPILALINSYMNMKVFENEDIIITSGGRIISIDKYHDELKEAKELGVGYYVAAGVMGQRNIVERALLDNIEDSLKRLRKMCLTGQR